jgi:fructokinase
MIRVGVDFGGTKIEAAVLDRDGRFLARLRAPSPPTYEDALAVVHGLVSEVERQAGARAPAVGLGIPGSVSPASGLIRNANSTHLNGRPMQADLEQVLGRPVRLANDANCLALSEAVDGAGAGARVVFAAILGTGCGGGVAIDRKVITGRNAIAGEWGHTPLPWPRANETPGPLCWCGRQGCLEQWICGPAFHRDGGPDDPDALGRYIDRLGRGLAVICDLIDPDVIVLGGGVSNVEALYARLPHVIAAHAFSDVFETTVSKAAHGDSSGVRGAAWLWPQEAGT